MSTRLTLVAPQDEVARAREAAYHEVCNALANHLHDGGIRVSPLGAAWSADVDAYLRTMPDDDELLKRGWLPLDALFGRLGSSQQGRWAVVVNGAIAGAADLHMSPPPDPVELVLSRCRRQGRAGPREVAELAALAQAGHGVPSTPPTRRLRRLRVRIGRVRRHLRPRIVIALTGIEGAGKTTLSNRLLSDLALAGVPSSGVSADLPPVSLVVPEFLGRAPGRAWRSLKVRLHAVRYAFTVWERYLASSGVVVFDGHADDAVVSLRLVHGLHKAAPVERLVVRAAPDPHVRVFLDVSEALVLARRHADSGDTGDTGDTGKDFVDGQVLDAYNALGVKERSLVLDGSRPSAEHSLTVATELVARTDGSDSP